MAVGDIHTVHNNGEWRNEVEGGARLGGTFASKEEAVAYGSEEAIERKAEHIIHDMDGTVSERNSYGNDLRANLAKEHRDAATRRSESW